MAVSVYIAQHTMQYTKKMKTITKLVYTKMIELFKNLPVVQFRKTLSELLKLYYYTPKRAIIYKVDQSRYKVLSQYTEFLNF